MSEWTRRTLKLRECLKDKKKRFRTEISKVRITLKDVPVFQDIVFYSVQFIII